MELRLDEGRVGGRLKVEMRLALALQLMLWSPRPPRQAGGSSWPRLGQDEGQMAKYKGTYLGLLTAPLSLIM